MFMNIFFKNVPRRFKTFFIVEDIFWKKSDGMKNYLDSEIDFRKNYVITIPLKYYKYKPKIAIQKMSSRNQNTKYSTSYQWLAGIKN